MKLSEMVDIACIFSLINVLLFLSDSLTIYHKDWKVKLKFRAFTGIDVNQMKRKQLESHVRPQSDLNPNLLTACQVKDSLDSK